MTPTDYARHRGCSDSSVRKAITEGRIQANGAGMIDPAAADAQWAANTMGEDRAAGHRPDLTPTMVQARRRKSLALTLGAKAELDRLHASLITPADAECAIAEQLAPLARAIRQLAATAAPRLAGSPAAEAEATLEAAINAMLLEVTGGGGEATDPPQSPDPRYDRMTTAAIEAHRVQIAAMKIEAEQALARGEAVHLDDIIAGLGERLVAVRVALSSLPGRTSVRFHAMSVAEATEFLAEELSSIAGELHLTELPPPPAASDAAERQKARWADPTYRTRMLASMRTAAQRRKAHG
jgi:hypothetical protein